MEVVASWTGGYANALRQALRMSNKAFADYLRVATRTVAYWRERPDAVPQPEIQRALDEALDRAPDRVKAQFGLLVNRTQEQYVDDERRLTAIEQRPARLDVPAIEALARTLTSQRRVEDAVGPAVVIQPVTTQLEAVTKILREASGPHRDDLARVVAEWTTYAGWLHIAVRKDDEALALLKRAEELADDAGDGVCASTATSFRGYLSLLQGRPKSAIRATASSLATHGAHETQRTMDMLQMAQSHAGLGDAEKARRFLEIASDMAASAGEPPPAVYWYTEPFFRLNIGMAQIGIGDYRNAVESLRSGIEDMPDDQRDADWMNEYRQALAFAEERS